MSHAETVAKQILRNDQAALRSAKETVLDMIGRDLDDQLRVEAINSYSLVARPEVSEHLRRFFDKTDCGRHGANQTPLI
jgi:enoyl-CoA hydratase/carnithine racemase